MELLINSPCLQVIGHSRDLLRDDGWFLKGFFVCTALLVAETFLFADRPSRCLGNADDALLSPRTSRLYSWPRQRRLPRARLARTRSLCNTRTLLLLYTFQESPGALIFVSDKRQNRFLHIIISFSYGHFTVLHAIVCIRLNNLNAFVLPWLWGTP